MTIIQSILGACLVVAATSMPAPAPAPQPEREMHLRDCAVSFRGRAACRPEPLLAVFGSRSVHHAQMHIEAG